MELEIKPNQNVFVLDVKRMQLAKNLILNPACQYFCIRKKKILVSMVTIIVFDTEDLLAILEMEP